MIRNFSLICLSLFVSACGGSPSGLQGHYIDTDDNSTSLHLDGRGAARLQSSGAQFVGSYAADGEHLTLDLDGLPPIRLRGDGATLVPESDTRLIAGKLGRVGGISGRFTHRSERHGELIATFERDGAFQLVLDEQGVQDQAILRGQYFHTSPYSLRLDIPSERPPVEIYVEMEDDNTLEITGIREIGRGYVFGRDTEVPLVLRR